MSRSFLDAVTEECRSNAILIYMVETSDGPFILLSQHGTELRDANFFQVKGTNFLKPVVEVAAQIFNVDVGEIGMIATDDSSVPDAVSHPWTKPKSLLLKSESFDLPVTEPNKARNALRLKTAILEAIRTYSGRSPPLSAVLMNPTQYIVAGTEPTYLVDPTHMIPPMLETWIKHWMESANPESDLDAAKRLRFVGQDLFEGGPAPYETIDIDTRSDADEEFVPPKPPPPKKTNTAKGKAKAKGKAAPHPTPSPAIRKRPTNTMVVEIPPANIDRSLYVCAGPSTTCRNPQPVRVASPEQQPPQPNAVTSTPVSPPPPSSPRISDPANQPMDLDPANALKGLPLAPSSTEPNSNPTSRLPGSLPKGPSAAEPLVQTDPKSGGTPPGLALTVEAPADAPLETRGFQVVLRDAVMLSFRVIISDAELEHRWREWQDFIGLKAFLISRYLSEVGSSGVWRIPHRDPSLALTLAPLMHAAAVVQWYTVCAGLQRYETPKSARLAPSQPFVNLATDSPPQTLFRSITRINRAVPQIKQLLSQEGGWTLRDMETFAYRAYVVTHDALDGAIGMVDILAEPSVDVASFACLVFWLWQTCSLFQTHPEYSRPNANAVHTLTDRSTFTLNALAVVRFLNYAVCKCVVSLVQGLSKQSPRALWQPCNECMESIIRSIFSALSGRRADFFTVTLPKVVPKSLVTLVHTLSHQGSFWHRLGAGVTARPKSLEFSLKTNLFTNNFLQWVGGLDGATWMQLSGMDRALIGIMLSIGLIQLVDCGEIDQPTQMEAFATTCLRLQVQISTSHTDAAEASGGPILPPLEYIPSATSWLGNPAWSSQISTDSAPAPPTKAVTNQPSTASASTAESIKLQRVESGKMRVLSPSKSPGAALPGVSESPPQDVTPGLSDGDMDVDENEAFADTQDNTQDRSPSPVLGGGNLREEPTGADIDEPRLDLGTSCMDQSKARNPPVSGTGSQLPEPQGDTVIADGLNRGRGTGEYSGSATDMDVSGDEAASTAVGQTLPNQHLPPTAPFEASSALLAVPLPNAPVIQPEESLPPAGLSTHPDGTPRPAVASTTSAFPPGPAPAQASAHPAQGEVTTPFAPSAIILYGNTNMPPPSSPLSSPPPDQGEPEENEDDDEASAGVEPGRE
ncbi:hypothetical protein FRB90_001474 [Tulasnella sp. 427]|nr:hypothetical protein FRB90_001474 [Tulasnella sp. 427]